MKCRIIIREEKGLGDAERMKEEQIEFSIGDKRFYMFRKQRLFRRVDYYLCEITVTEKLGLELGIPIDIKVSASTLHDAINDWQRNIWLKKLAKKRSKKRSKTR